MSFKVTYRNLVGGVQFWKHASCDERKKQQVFEISGALLGRMVENIQKKVSDRMTQKLIFYSAVSKI